MMLRSSGLGKLVVEQRTVQCNIYVKFFLVPLRRPDELKIICVR